MPNLVQVTYAQTGESSKYNKYGMREMQAFAYEKRNEQYLLVKAPPASGKSRALMFIALDKLRNQGIKKAIVAVPQKAIGSSFKTTKLSDFGFFADWELKEQFNLCTPDHDGDTGTIQAFKNFMDNEEQILICTHATLRFAFEQIDVSKFNDTLLAIDEFHHVSAEAGNRLGELLRSVMDSSNTHIVGMSGSYFRGDGIPVLSPDDEDKFEKVPYNYYQQLNGYSYLKSLGIGYHFYQGPYTSAIMEVLDTDKKTILHIPNVNAAESLKQKYNEVGYILGAIGKVVEPPTELERNNGIVYVKRNSDAKIIKVADLVNDEPREREKVANYLRSMTSVDDIDLIIALGMAKEGFDWPWCEHALTVGYRGSLTEIIQILGRCTRDSDNKTHAQFTNLIAEPEAVRDEVKGAVNNMLKAIAASLLMEQVLAPNFKFKTKLTDTDKALPGELKVKGFKMPSSKRVKDIIETDLNDLKAAILQDDMLLRAMCGTMDAEVINKELVANVIREKYPTLTDDQLEEVRQYVVLDSVVKNNLMIDVKDLKKAILNDDSVKKAMAENMSASEINNQLIPKVVKSIYPELTDDEANSFSKLAVNIQQTTNETGQSDKRFIKMAGKFVNIDDLSIDMIDQVNPFQKAYEILSKTVNTSVLKVIQDEIASTRIAMTLGEAIILWPKINEFVKIHQREPNINSIDPLEVRMAQALILFKKEKRNRQSNA